MKKTENVGIAGIGTFLPSKVRSNSDWPDATLERWRQRATRAEARVEDPSKLDRDAEILMRVQNTMHADDPFRGARERRVMPDGMTALDMAEAAARDAVARAGVTYDEIDLVLAYDMVPDVLASNSAARLHHRLGLPSRCITLAADTACNSFLTQLSIARSMIESSAANVALLVQTCAFSRVMPYEEAYSTLFGDGATAVIVRRVGGNRGILAEVHRTDGGLDGGLVITGERGGWWSADRATVRPTDATSAPRMLLAAGAMARSAVLPAIQEAGLTPSDIRFYASHQATCWFRTATQEILGLTQARSVDTFPWAGSLSASNVPLVLSVGEREGLLGDGDPVVMFTGGGGVTYSAMVVAWGT